jgi:hypothetical protein
MANKNITHEVAVAKRDGSTGPSQPPNLRAAIMPTLYAALGISLGSLTGISIALVTAPNGAAAAYSDSAQTSATGSQVAVSPKDSSAPKGELGPAAPLHDNAGTIQRVSYSLRSTASHGSSGPEKSFAASKTHRSSAVKAAPRKIPAAKWNSERRSSPAQDHPAKPNAHPFVPIARKALASAPEVLPEPVDNEQLSYVDDSKPSGFVIEGVLKVADYDAAAGTIETSDGRTFAIGTTVSMSSAASWNEYRSDVHYRCGQNGSCTLTRAGVVAPNARVI